MDPKRKEENKHAQPKCGGAAAARKSYLFRRQDSESRLGCDGDVMCPGLFVSFERPSDGLDRSK